MYIRLGLLLMNFRQAMQNTLLIAEEEIHRLRSEGDCHADDARDALQDVDSVIRKLSEKVCVCVSIKFY